MVDELVLFDLPCKGRNACWSGNVWKIRLVLNYKNIPYNTEWVDFPDLETRFRGHLKPVEGPAPYTVPTIKLPDGTYIRDSVEIAPVLEQMVPEPSISVSHPTSIKVVETVKVAFMQFIPIVLPRVPPLLSSEETAILYRKNIVDRFGISIEALANTEKATQWFENMGPHLDALKQLLHQDESGPFFLGHSPCFGDFAFVGALCFTKKTGDDLFERIVGYDDGFRALYDACSPWLEKDD